MPENDWIDQMNRGQLAAEFAGDLRQMPHEDLAIIEALVLQERRSRQQKVEYQDVSSLQADVDQVRGLFNLWTEAMEKRINQPGKTLGYMDAFMAVVNLARWVLEGIERQQEFDSIEKKRTFRALWLTTAERSLMKRLEN